MTWKSKLIKIGLPLIAAPIVGLGGLVAKDTYDVHENDSRNFNWTESANIAAGRTWNDLSGKTIEEAARTITENEKLEKNSGSLDLEFDALKIGNKNLIENDNEYAALNEFARNQILENEGKIDSLNYGIDSCDLFIDDLKEKGQWNEPSGIVESDVGFEENLSPIEDTDAGLEENLSSTVQKPKWTKVSPTQEQIAGLDSIVVEKGNRFGDLYGAINYELAKQGKSITPDDVEVYRNGKLVGNKHKIWEGDLLVVKKEAPVVEKEVIPFADLKTADLNGDEKINHEDLSVLMENYKGISEADLTDKGEFNGVDLNVFDLYELTDKFGEEELVDRYVNPNSGNDVNPFAKGFDDHIAEKNTPKVEEKGKNLVSLGTRLYDGSIVLETSFDHLFDNGFGLGLGVSGSEDNASVLGRVSVGNDDVRAGLMAGVTVENPEDDGRIDLRTPVTLGAFAQARIPGTENTYVEVNGGITGVRRTLDSDFNRGKFGSVKLGWTFGDDGRSIELKPVEIYDLEDSKVDSNYAAPVVKDTSSAEQPSTMEELLIEANEHTAESQNAITPLLEESVEKTKEVIKAQDATSTQPTIIIDYDNDGKTTYKDCNLWLQNGENLVDTPFDVFLGTDRNPYDFFELVYKNEGKIEEIEGDKNSVGFANDYEDYIANIRPHLKLN